MIKKKDPAELECFKVRKSRGRFPRQFFTNYNLILITYPVVTKTGDNELTWTVTPTLSHPGLDDYRISNSM